MKNKSQHPKKSLRKVYIPASGIVEVQWKWGTSVLMNTSESEMEHSAQVGSSKRI